MYGRLIGRMVVILIAVCLSFFAMLATALTTSIPKGDLMINLELVCNGLIAPVTATHAGDRSKRLFIVDQAGTIRIYDQKRDHCLDMPFLDLTNRIVEVNPRFDERGLLGLAFHPRFRNNGRFYVRYSAPREGSEDEPCFGSSRGCHTAVLSEFKMKHRYSNMAESTPMVCAILTDFRLTADDANTGKARGSALGAQTFMSRT